MSHFLITGLNTTLLSKDQTHSLIPHLFQHLLQISHTRLRSFRVVKQETPILAICPYYFSGCCCCIQQQKTKRTPHLRCVESGHRIHTVGVLQISNEK